MDLVLETLARRWYVVAFLAAYAATSVPDRGWLATIRFWLIAGVVAFAAEFSSTRNGFPFGRYTYTGATRGDELYLSNIPAFVPAAYATMIAAGRSLAGRITGAWSGWRLVVGGGIATLAVDVVVDPVAVRGEQWFLGDLFSYANPDFFGVALANFAGWVLVAAFVIAADLLFERGEAPSPRGLGLAAGVLGFNLLMGLVIGATLAVTVSALVASAILAALVPLRARTPMEVSTP